MSSKSPAKSTNTTTTATPRKQPCCRQCGRPRAGHPRSGCPDSTPTKEDDDVLVQKMSDISFNSTASPRASARLAKAKVLVPPLDWALEDTDAAKRTRRRQSRQSAAPLEPTESLSSIPSDTSEIMRSLVSPADGSDTEIEEVQASPTKRRIGENKAVHWKSPKARKSGVKKELMPCTLIAPTPESSFASSSGSLIVRYIEPSETSSARSSSVASSQSSSSSTEPLSFIDMLGKRYSSTQARMLPKEDIMSIEREALEHGLHTRRVAADEADSQQLLVIGQDPADTQRFCEALKDKENEDNKKGGRGSVLKSVAGGLVVGAVGAVAALAYA
ncbi:hypothetical protein CYLTODRAFT_187789 [Cylindrobasidium torrendii FP15055 ss-10]|uniref:Uncharacterized protein n=1 Tax=Cylindrobasidium torrendii FP15055 ss-10 TaxID=1314674 RepID=A0A0D7BLA7_9AGAR|nr:hypothetical protein CYLTODRAFT_187789 [Cylindrobasidium torrendii FP15055 ss-10]